MGACGSSEAPAQDGGQQEEMKQSRNIDKLLREEERRLSREVKVGSLLEPALYFSLLAGRKLMRPLDICLSRFIRFYC